MNSVVLFILYALNVIDFPPVFFVSYFFIINPYPYNEVPKKMFRGFATNKDFYDRKNNFEQVNINMVD